MLRLAVFSFAIAGIYASTQLIATCEITKDTGEEREPVTGTVTFRQSASGGKTTIDINLMGFRTDDNNVEHGFHVHNKGLLGNKCKDAEGHYNPFHKEHGAPTDVVRHVGDLGNILEDASGNCKTTITDSEIQLQGPHSVVGRSIVVHERIDDLGRGGHPDSKITGNAGPRSGCCIIKLV